MPHLKRPALSRHHPVHVTLRVGPGVGYLRAHSPAKVIREAIREAEEQFGMRVVHYSVQGNHLHLIAEAEDEVSLSRGMQGLMVRVARRLNRLSRRKGTVFADRYHAHQLRSRREVANAVRYVVGNYRHHAREYLPPRWDDPFATHADAPAVAPRTWLLRVGWKLDAPGG